MSDGEALRQLRREIESLIAARALAALSDEEEARYELLLHEEADLLRQQRHGDGPAS